MESFIVTNICYLRMPRIHLTDILVFLYVRMLHNWLFWACTQITLWRLGPCSSVLTGDGVIPFHYKCFIHTLDAKLCVKGICSIDDYSILNLTMWYLWRRGRFSSITIDLYLPLPLTLMLSVAIPLVRYFLF